MFIRLHRLFDRADFRARPARALARRLRWRARWLARRSPWRLPTPLGYRLWIPHSGSGALIYYQGFSEPETARFLLRFLSPGMAVFDVGAHFGEYTVLAARCIGPSGAVHAFEPQPALFALLARNVAENHLRNVVLNPCAVAEAEGQAAFWERREPASSSLAGACAPDGGVARAYPVTVCSLDAYCERRAVTPDFIKVDVEGAERLVLAGARRLCSLPADRAPAWLLEHSPSACARFGDRAERISELLASFGYRCFSLAPDGAPVPWAPPPPQAPTQNLVAAKRRLP